MLTYLATGYPEDSGEPQDDGAGDDIPNPGAGGWAHLEEELEALTPRAGSPQPDLPYEQASQPDPYASPPGTYASQPDPYTSQPGTFASQPDTYYPSASSIPSYAQHSMYGRPPEAIQGDTGELYRDIDDRKATESVKLEH